MKYEEGEKAAAVRTPASRMYKHEACKEGGSTAVSEGQAVIAAFPVGHVFLLVPEVTTVGQLLIVMQLGK